MGGDHKCPVCQATFTRPQHVARHMRSHTGDRPYKCQFCGDQFARSDLLARHVNKCHANEKPLLPNPGPRRKGSASTSRATTSKQACDQCVQGSLPCDGCNPCAKCIQRKIRCTFVKFHRQTAPVGPGHHAPPDLAPSLPSLSASIPPDPTSLQLDPAPLTVPSMASGPAATTFMFPPIYPDDPPQQRGLLPGEPSDFSTRYRVRADLLRRRGEEVALTGSLSLPPPPRSSGGFSDLDLRMRPQTSSSSGSSAGSWGWDSPSVRYAEQTHTHPLRHIMALSTDYRPSIPISHSHHQHHHTRTARGGIPTEYDLETLDFSDASTTSTRSSASASVVGRMGDRIGRGFNTSLAAQHLHQEYPPSPLDTQTISHPHSQPSSYHPSPTVPGFVPASVMPHDFDESAFGALSLEEPALLAPDAPPFFSEELFGGGTGGGSLAGRARAREIDPSVTPTAGVSDSRSAMGMGIVGASSAGTRLVGPPSTGTGTTTSGASEGDGELWHAFMRNTPLAEGGPAPGKGQPPSQEQRPQSAASTTTSTSTSTSYSSYAHAQQYQNHHEYDRRMSLGHIHHHPQQQRHEYDRRMSLGHKHYQQPTQQPPDDLAAYQAAVLLHARETESEIVLRPPPTASTLKQRRSTDAEFHSASAQSSRPGAFQSLPPPPPSSAPPLSGNSSALLRPPGDVASGTGTGTGVVKGIPRPVSTGSLSNASISPSSLVSSSLVGAVDLGVGSLNGSPLIGGTESWSPVVAGTFASSSTSVDVRPGMKRTLSSTGAGVATCEEPQMKRRGAVGECDVAEGVAEDEA